MVVYKFIHIFAPLYAVNSVWRIAFSCLRCGVYFYTYLFHIIQQQLVTILEINWWMKSVCIGSLRLDFHCIGFGDVFSTFHKRKYCSIEILSLRANFQIVSGSSYIMTSHFFMLAVDWFITRAIVLMIFYFWWARLNFGLRKNCVPTSMKSKSMRWPCCALTIASFCQTLLLGLVNK